MKQNLYMLKTGTLSVFLFLMILNPFFSFARAMDENPELMVQNTASHRADGETMQFCTRNMCLDVSVKTENGKKVIDEDALKAQFASLPTSSFDGITEANFLEAEIVYVNETLSILFVRFTDSEDLKVTKHYFSSKYNHGSNTKINKSLILKNTTGPAWVANHQTGGYTRIDIREISSKPGNVLLGHSVTLRKNGFIDRAFLPYACEAIVSGKVSLPENQILTDDQFEFKLVKEGTTETFASAKNLADGSFSFSIPNLNATGNTTYTLSQNNATRAAGYILDEKKYIVDVAVTLGAEPVNTLNASISIKNADDNSVATAIEFENAIEETPDPITAEVKGKVTLGGIAPAADLFEFELTSDFMGAMIPVTFAKNLSDGTFIINTPNLSSVTSSPIVYELRQADLGVATNNYNLDNKIYTVEVSVSLEATSNTLIPSVIYKDATGAPVTEVLFENTEKTPSAITAEVKGKVTLAGIAPAADLFEFELASDFMGSMIEVGTAKNLSDGTFTINTPNLTSVTSSPIIYELRQADLGVATNNYNLDNKIYTVEVSVDLDAFNTLVPTVTYKDATGTPVTEVLFENTVKTPSAITAEVKGKVTLGGIAPAADLFEFELTSEDLSSITVLGTVKNLSDGTFTINTPNFAAATSGSVIYQLKQKNLGDANYNYDSQIYTVEVSVSLEATSNTLIPSVIYKDATGAPVTEVLFENTVKTPSAITAEVKGKVTLGGIAPAADLFEFELTSEDLSSITVLGTVKNLSDGTFTINTPNLTSVTSSPVIYQLRQKDLGVATNNYNLDNKIYTVEVSVILDASNTLVPTVIYMDATGAPVTEVLFENTVKTPEVATASVDGKVELEGATLVANTFKFVIKKQGEATASPEVTHTAPDGTFTIDIPNLSEITTTNPLIYELSQKDLGVANYVYDDKIYTVEVSVSLDGATNKLEATHVIKDPDSNVVTVALFKNKYEVVVADETQTFWTQYHSYDFPLTADKKKVDKDKLMAKLAEDYPSATTFDGITALNYIDNEIVEVANGLFALYVQFTDNAGLKVTKAYFSKQFVRGAVVEKDESVFTSETKGPSWVIIGSPYSKYETREIKVSEETVGHVIVLRKDGYIDRTFLPVQVEADETQTFWTQYHSYDFPLTADKKKVDKDKLMAKLAVDYPSATTFDGITALNYIDNEIVEVANGLFALYVQFTDNAGLKVTKAYFSKQFVRGAVVEKDESVFTSETKGPSWVIVGSPYSKYETREIEVSGETVGHVLILRKTGYIDRTFLPVQVVAPAPVTDASLDAFKNLEGKLLEDQEFEFHIYSKDSLTGLPVTTAKNNAAGYINFTFPAFTEVGEYLYSVKEKDIADNPHYLCDETVFDVKVDVSLDAANNKLVAVVSVLSNPIVFNNIYVDYLALVEVTEISKTICEGAEINLADYVKYKLALDLDFLSLVAYVKGESQALESTVVKPVQKTTYVIKSKNTLDNEEGEGIEIEINISPAAHFTSTPVNYSLAVNQSAVLTAEFNLDANASIEWYDEKGNLVTSTNDTPNSSSISVSNHANSEKGVVVYTIKLIDACSSNVIEKQVEVEYFLDTELTVLQKSSYLLSANNNSDSNGGYVFKEYEWFIITSLGANPELASGKSNLQNYTPDSKKKTSLNMDAQYQLKVITTDGKVLRTAPFKIKQTREFKLDFTAYPNPVKVNSEVILKLENFLASEYDGAKIYVYSTLGVLKHLIEVKADETRFTLSEKGIYYIHFKSTVLDGSKTIIVE